jgi:hypothetical protein
MASGTAVVTTGAGTEDYAFHEVNALVIASRDPDGMAAAVCRLIEDETLRATLVSAGLKTARTYTWDRAVQEREAMLVDIHYDRISYDRFKGVSLGLTDVTGREFERAPVAVLPKNAGGLYWSPAGHLFLLHDGMQRHVQSGDLVPVLVERGWMYIEMDELQIARIPAGFPLRTANDVPYCRQDASDA